MRNREIERVVRDIVNHHPIVDAVALRYGSDGEWAGAILDSDGTRLVYATAPSLAFLAELIGIAVKELGEQDVQSVE